MKRVRFALFILSIFTASGLTIFFRTPIQAAIVSSISAQHEHDGEKPSAKHNSAVYLASDATSPEVESIAGKVLGVADALQGVLNINVPTVFNSAVDIASSITRGDASVQGVLTVAGKSVFQGPVTLQDDVSGKDVNITLTGASKITAPNLVNSLIAGDGLSVSGTQNITITNTDLGSSQKIIKSIKVGGDTLTAGSNTSVIEFKTNNGLTLSANTSDNVITFGASGTDLNVSGFGAESGTVHLTTSTDVVGIGTTSPDPGKKLHVVGDTKLEGTLIVTGIANFSGGVIVTSGIDNLSGGISNAGSITGGTGLTSSGTITFSGMSTGIVHSSFGGVMSSSALNLAAGSSEVLGILPGSNGGTGINGSTYLTGDLLYASSNGTLSRLGVGGSGQVLTVAGGLPSWGSSGASNGPCSTCVIKDPGSTQTIAATGSAAIALSIRPASGGTVDIFNVTDTSGATKYFRVDKDGNVILGTGTTSTTGNLTVAPANTDYLAIAPVAQGLASFTGSITSEDLTATRTWTFPDSTGTICLTTGNCNGIGSNFGGSGVTNYIAKFSGTYAVQNSLLYDSGFGVGIGTTSPAYSLDVSGNMRALGNTVFGGTLDATGAARLANTLQVSGATSLLSTLNVTGTATLSSTLSVTGNGIFNGNVGIGTTNPAYNTQLYASAPSFGITDSSNLVNLVISQTGGAAFFRYGCCGTNMRFAQNGPVGFGGLNPSGLAGVAVSTITAPTVGLVVRGVAAQTANLQQWQNTNGTVLALVAADGNVGVGTTTPVAPLHISTGYGANAAMIVNNLNSGDLLTASASGVTKLQLSSAGTLRLNAYGAGSVTTDANGNIVTSSDERLKNITGEFSRGLFDLMKLTPKIYKWNELSGLDQVHNYAGFIAQNVQSAIPEAVSSGANGYLTLQDRPILATAINAIKEQQGMIDLLTSATVSAQLTAAGDVTWKEAVDSRLTNLESRTATMSAQIPATPQILAQTGGIHAYASWMSNVWTFLSQVIFNDIVTFNEAVTFAKNVVIAGRVTSKDVDSAGFAIIDAGKQQVAVTFEKPYTSKPIISITAEDYTGTFSTHEATRGGFLIRLSTPATDQVILHWKASEVEGAKIIQGSTVLPDSVPNATP